MKASLKLLWIAALFAWVSEGGHAGPVAPLTSFTSGTPAKASEVNGNFSAVSTAVNDNNSRITTLEGVNAASRITALELGAASPNVTGNVTLAPSTPTAGNIPKGTAPFVHNFGSDKQYLRRRWYSLGNAAIETRSEKAQVSVLNVTEGKS